jgi:hypothetical protein
MDIQPVNANANANVNANANDTNIINDTKSKRIRKHNAKELPAGITQNMLQKYVVYYREWINKEHKKQREYFKVEGHPKLEKVWIGNKSSQFSVLEKLKQANSFVEELDKPAAEEAEAKNANDSSTANAIELPKYVSLVHLRNKATLYYDKKTSDGIRISVKMVLPEKYNIQEQLCILNEKVKCKNETYNITNSSSNINGFSS